MIGQRPNDALQSLPGIGPSLARSLMDLGYRRVGDLPGEDPEAMYRRLCDLRGERIDRCVLYCLRCAVHVAANPAADPEARMWWNWMDRDR